MIRLRKVREDRGLTQEYVARAVNVTKWTIHDLETGRRIGNVRVWDALEDLFGIPQRQLREEGGEMGCISMKR